MAHWESGTPAWGWGLEVSEGRDSPNHALIHHTTHRHSHPHNHVLSHTTCHTGTHAESHTLSITRSPTLGFGGSGRAPGGGYVNALTAPLLAPPHPPPASSCSASARGCLAGAREQLGLAEAPGAEKPDPTQPQAEPGRGTQSTPPQHTQGPAQPPQRRLTHILGQHLGPTDNTPCRPPSGTLSSVSPPECAPNPLISGTRKGQRSPKGREWVRAEAIMLVPK